MGEIISFGDTKDSLRKRMTLLRECMPPGEREKASYLIFDALFNLPEFQNADTIYSFAGFGSEVYTLNHLFKMIKMGKRVALPRMEDDERLEFYEVRKISDIRKGPLGIMEPDGSYPPIDVKPDIILMPGVAFDRRFNRLGYGKGYYDRYLYETGYYRFVWKIAICFGCQIANRVPSDKHDIIMDMIITEKEIIR